MTEKYTDAVPNLTDHPIINHPCCAQKCSTSSNSKCQDNLFLSFYVLHFSTNVLNLICQCKCCNVKW